MIVGGGGDTVRVWWLADGTRSPIRWTCLNRHGSPPLHANIIVTAGDWDIAIHQPAAP
jgi:hypothetical protein